MYLNKIRLIGYKATSKVRLIKCYKQRTIEVFRGKTAQNKGPAMYLEVEL